MYRPRSRRQSGCPSIGYSGSGRSASDTRRGRPLPRGSDSWTETIWSGCDVYGFPRVVVAFVATLRGCSSVGRARPWHGRGHGFDSRQLHSGPPAVRAQPGPVISSSAGCPRAVDEPKPGQEWRPPRGRTRVSSGRRDTLLRQCLVAGSGSPQQPPGLRSSPSMGRPHVFLVRGRRPSLSKHTRGQSPVDELGEKRGK